MNFQRSLELFAEAYRLIPGGSQTNSKRPQAFAYGAYPIFAERAFGCRIEDVDGNTYIDLVTGLGPIVLGYNYPAVQEAVADQLGRGTLAGLLFPAEVEAARAIVGAVPCAEAVRFFKGGAEATSAAARIARGFTGREVILNCGYRGWSDVWTAAMNDGGVPKGLEASIATFPFNDLPALEKLFDQYPDQVAAVFLDIMVVEPDPGYLQGVKDLAHRHGALLAFDEIVTGFRLAVGGAQEYFGVTPDLACFAKGLANGMPLSAVAGRADVMKVAENLLISITYGGEALSLAAAAAAIAEIRRKNVPDHLWRVGQLLSDGLEDAARRHDVPFQCVGFAPMKAMRFDGLDADREGLVWSYVLQEMAARGVLLRRGGLNFVTYSHSEDDIRQVVAAADEGVADLGRLWQAPELADHVRVLDVEESFRTFSVGRR